MHYCVKVLAFLRKAARRRSLSSEDFLNRKERKERKEMKGGNEINGRR